MNDEIDITGIDHAKLLHALYHGTRPVGLGILHNKNDFSFEDAQAIMDATPQIPGMIATINSDYVAGRPIKIMIDGNWLRHVFLYDRDAGQGAAQRIVEKLRLELAK